MCRSFFRCRCLQIAIEPDAWRDYCDGVARVAQLDRASVSEAEGCGFDPRRAHQRFTSVSCCPSLPAAESF